MAVRCEGAVLVGAEPSRCGMAAVDLAADVAADRRAELVMLHAAVDAGVGADFLATAVRRALARRPGLTVCTELTGEPPATALLSFARLVDLMVVGHHGRGTGRPHGSPAGSVAVRVADRSPVPVIVHRPLEGPGSVGRPVVVGVGTAPADGPLAFAFAEAARLAVPLVVEHVWSGPADNHPAVAGLDRGPELAALDAATRLLSDTVAVWSDKFPDVEVRRALRHGLDPAFALTAASRAARLLVVGSTGSAEPLIRAVVHRAGCPVAVVPS